MVKDPKYKNKPPRGGWKWPTVDGLSFIHGTSVEDLHATLTHHYMINHQQGVPSLQEVIDHFCDNGSIECMEMDQDFRDTIVAGASLYYNLIKAKFDKGVEPLVDRETANARAKVCARGDGGEACPMNVDIGNTCKGGCGQKTPQELVNLARGPILRQLMKFTSRGEVELTTDYDGQINDCKACGCKIANKVHVNLDIINEDPSAALYWEGCWVLTEQQKKKD